MFWCHYLYVERYAMQVLFWLTLGGMFIWYILDGFLMFMVVDVYNRKLSMQILDELFDEGYARYRASSGQEVVPTFAGLGESSESNIPIE